MKEKNNKKIFVIVIFIIFVLVEIYLLNLYMRQKEIDEARDYMADEKITIDNDTDESIIENSERIDKLKEFQLENPNIVAWLEIPNTIMSYPILQGTDNSYYMKHNYKNKTTKEGSIFLDKDYDWDKPSTNLLMYGHNNRGSNEMFVGLLDYKEESFYKEHSIIRFTTENEDAIYDIISVFLSRVYYKDETDVFRYYYFIDANNEEEYNYYVNESKKASLYNINATAKYGDQLLTLSTCEWSQDDGRFVVVARKRK